MGNVLWVTTCILWSRYCGGSCIYCGHPTRTCDPQYICVNPQHMPTTPTICTHNVYNCMYCGHTLWVSTIYTLLSTTHSTPQKPAPKITHNTYVYIVGADVYLVRVSILRRVNIYIVGAAYILWVYIVDTCCGCVCIVDDLLYIVGMYCGCIARHCGCVYVLWVRICCGEQTPTTYTSCTHNTLSVCICCGDALWVILVLPMGTTSPAMSTLRRSTREIHGEPTTIR